MSLAVTFYDVVQFFHVLAVVLGFGPTYAYGVFIATAQRHDPRGVPAVLRGIIAWDRIGSFMLLVILAAGLYMVADSPAWSFSDFYISWGFVAVIVAGGLLGGFFQPQSKQALELAERDIAASGEGEISFSAEFEAINKRLASVGMGLGLFIVLTIYVMVAKPFL
jgi:hypothetical protein